MATDWPRVIFHADLDAFYAAVEQLDDPRLRGRPVLVGGASDRGVVLTASYEARPSGVGSAMAMAVARRRCPQAVIVPPRFERYLELSQKVFEVFAQFSPTVEALSLDEAFLEMTGAEGVLGRPERSARALKEAVLQATGLVISVGVSSTKYVAKVASDIGKPDGLVLVPAEMARGFLAPLPVSRLWGAGPKTAARLEGLGLHRIGDVARADPSWLARHFGVAGPHFHRLARAEDPRPVLGRRGAKSVGSERTLAVDVLSRAAIEGHLRRSADEIGRRLRRKGLCARGVRVKLKTHRFHLLSRQAPLKEPTNVGRRLFQAAAALLDRFEPRRGPFRLVGMAAFGLEPVGPEQLELFEDRGRLGRLEQALDQVRDRFGAGALFRAEDLGRARSSLMGVNLDALRDQGEGQDLPGSLASEEADNFRSGEGKLD